MQTMKGKLETPLNVEHTLWKDTVIATGSEPFCEVFWIKNKHFWIFEPSESQDASNIDRKHNLWRHSNVKSALSHVEPSLKIGTSLNIEKEYRKKSKTLINFT